MYMSEHLVRMNSYRVLNENDSTNQSPNVFISVRQKLIIIIVIIIIIIIIRIDIVIIISCIIVLIKIIISIIIIVSFMVIIIINFIQDPLRLCFYFVQSLMTFWSSFFPWNKACSLIGQDQAYLSFWSMKSLGVRQFPQNAMPVPFKIHLSPHTLSFFPNSLTVPHLNVYKP